MKKLFWCCAIISLTLVFVPIKMTQAYLGETIEVIEADEDGLIEFQFLGEDTSQTSVEAYPIRIRLEGLNTEVVQIRMIWDLADESLDEVYPVSIVPTMNESIPVTPGESVYDASARIDFEESAGELYGGSLFLNNLPSHSGLQLMMADFPNNNLGQEENYIMMTQLNEDIYLNVDEFRGQIADLDYRMEAWESTVGGNFHRVYPFNNLELNHGGLTLDGLLNQMTLDGQVVNPLVSEDYNLHAVYSTTTVGMDHQEYITYLMVDYLGEAQVWVSEQRDTSQWIDFHLSENADIRELFAEWYQK